MGNTCLPQKGVRFKNFVVAVYPDDPRGGPVRDALGKLGNYVASNPERIPRVCRKISKLQAMYLMSGKVHRVMVGVQMLRELIAQSDDVNGFVPHSIDICSTLLSSTTAEYRIGAADVLTILCYKLAGRAGGEQSCRLITDSKGKLLPPLEKMCLENISSNDATAQHCRYAAIVALGNIIFCLQGVLTDLVNHIAMPFLQNLYNTICSGGKSMQSLSDANALLQQQRGYNLVGGPFNSVAFPSDPVERAMAYINASSWGTGAVGGCVSTARVHLFLQQVEEFITSRGAWSPTAFPSIVFLSLARAMERRPQRIGFSVCQFLCCIGVAQSQNQERDEEKSEKVELMRRGIIHALTLCAAEVRMVGGRPQVVFDLVRGAGGAAEAGMLELRLELLLSLLRATHRWRNAPQLHLLLVGLLECVREELARDAEGALGALAAAAPYVRVVPLSERTDIDMVEVIEPFLSSHDETQAYAARVLVALIAGAPPVVVGDDRRNGCADALPLPPLPPLVTEMRDVATAERWVLSVVSSGKPVTALCVTEVGQVLWAVQQCRGSHALPFSLSLVYQLQALVSKTKKNAELHLAWAHLSLVVLSNCGTLYNFPRLGQYALELLQRRLQLNELSPHFSVHLGDDGVIALHLAKDGDRVRGKQQRLLRVKPADGPRVTCHIDFVVVAEIIADAAGADVIAVLGGAQGCASELNARIAAACFSGNAAADVLPPLSPRTRARAGCTFTLGPTGALQRHGSKESITVSVVDAGALSPVAVVAAGAASSNAAPLAGTVKGRIAALLAHHNVDATTHLLKSSKCVGQIPLEMRRVEEEAEAEAEAEEEAKAPGEVLKSEHQPHTANDTLRRPSSRRKSMPVLSHQVALPQMRRADDDGFYANGLNSLATTDAIRLRTCAGAGGRDKARGSSNGGADCNVDWQSYADGCELFQATSGAASAWGVALPASRYIHLL